MNVFKDVYEREPEWQTSAPGRIEVIGNHVDYNGGLVLGAAINRRIRLFWAPNQSDHHRFVSGGSREPIKVPAGRVVPQDGPGRWTNYILGVMDALQSEGLALPGGWDIAVDSDLPSGAGLSSSAALEMATAVGINAICHGNLDTKSLVRAARRAENEFVGVPCGILDQGVVGFGQPDGMVAIDCAAESFSAVALPEDTRFWIFNSQVKHSLLDSYYATRHRECTEALRHLNREIPGIAQLALVTSAQLEKALPGMPEVLGRRARHVVEEQARVQHLLEALRRGKEWSAIGHLLTASHASSRDLFENSCPELDFLVDSLVPCPEVYGARLTGGGFGGAVLAVTSKSFGPEQSEAIKQTYERKFGTSPQVISFTPDEGAKVEK